MDYLTFEPSHELKPFVKCYWTLDGLKKEVVQRQTIVPDGCMEMICHYGDLYNQYIENGEKVLQPKCFIIGQLTRPLEIEPTGETGVFAVRFHPEGFLPFTVANIKEFENKAIALREIFGKDGLDLERNILGSKTTRLRIHIVEKFLSKCLSQKETVHRFVRSIVETILSADGRLSIDEISRLNNISRRQLERKFSSSIGLSPKKLSRTIRLQATLRKLLAGEFKNLTALAYHGEYYDQAHFIKDFKDFTGRTPKEFYGEKLIMSSLFYGSD